MIFEKWKYWKPGGFITQDYKLTQITYGQNGIYIIIESNKKNKPMFKLFFGDIVEMYRVVDERSMQNRFCDVTTINGDNFFLGKSFFTIENSKLSKWLEEESAGLVTCFELKHFVILSGDKFFDIIAHADPDIKEL